jgi:hypothetical protein
MILDEGFRPGEVFCLRWPHVLLNDDGTGLIQIVEGKSKAARRALPMTPRIHELLLARYEVAGRPGDGWIFPMPADGPYQRQPHEGPTQDRTGEIWCHGFRAIRAAPHSTYTVRRSRRKQYLHRRSNCGHASLAKTKRYVHPQAEAINRVFAAASQLLVGTKLGTAKKPLKKSEREKLQRRTA